MKFILLINVKITTIVGILTFISMMNITSERLKAIYLFICRYFSFYEQLKFARANKEANTLPELNAYNLKTLFQGYKTFSCSNQLSMKFILLINVKMPTSIGISTFINRINATSERFKADKIYFSEFFPSYRQ